MNCKKIIAPQFWNFEKDPPKTVEAGKPVGAEKFATRLEKYRNIEPRQR